MRYEELMRDAQNQALMASTRVHAAFDAIYCCCPPAGTPDEGLGALDLSPPDKALVISLRDWVQHVAPLGAAANIAGPSGCSSRACSQTQRFLAPLTRGHEITWVN